MTANIEPANWQVEPDPPLTLVICESCGHEEETDQLVETCERCESDDVVRYVWIPWLDEWEEQSL